MLKHKVGGRCFICSSSKDIKDIPNLYTNGSEGTLICETCEINLLAHLSIQIDLVDRAKGTHKRSEGQCAVCDDHRSLKEIRNFGLGGSGGKTTFCHTCEMDLISHIRSQANLGARARKGGFLMARRNHTIKPPVETDDAGKVVLLNHEEDDTDVMFQMGKVG